MSCMYGESHAGDAYVVRSKVGRTVGVLCQSHWLANHKALQDRGYHLHTLEEMAARGELADERERPQSASEGVVSERPEESGQPPDYDSGGDTQTVELAPERPVRGDPGRRPHGSTADQLITSGRSPLAGGQVQAEEKALVSAPARARTEGGGLPDRAGGTPAIIEPAPVDVWQRAGSLTLTEEQRLILQPPFAEDLVQVRWDGVVYVPWVFYWDRLLRAFSPYVPALIPLGKPYPVENTLCRDYVMVVNGLYVRDATGECIRAGGNQKLTYASAVEACRSDAITKCGKSLGMGAQLFDPTWRDYYLATYGEEYRDDQGRKRWRKKHQIEEHD